MLTERDKEKIRLDVADEQIDTVGRAFLGLTLAAPGVMITSLIQ